MVYHATDGGGPASLFLIASAIREGSEYQTVLGALGELRDEQSQTGQSNDKLENRHPVLSLETSLRERIPSHEISISPAQPLWRSHFLCAAQDREE
jgi:hypothetical protein